MITCEDVKQQISAYLDGELSERHTGQVRAHLEGCADCAAYRDDLAAVNGLLDETPSVAAPEEFTESVLERVNERVVVSWRERLRRAAMRPLPGWAVAAAMAGAIIIGSLLAWIGEPPTQSGTRVARRTSIKRQFGLDAFDDLPDGTVGNAYVKVVRSEGGDGR